MHTLSRLRFRGALSFFVCLGLSACSQQEPAAPPVSAPAAESSAAPNADQAVSPGDALELARRADQALREQRLFLPPGDNAFELLLAAIDADPDTPNTRMALADLVPYAVLHVEQQTAAAEAEDAARTLALIARADPQAPALPRLQRGLDALLASQAEAAARQTAVATATPVTPAPAPIPAAPALIETAEPPPSPADALTPAVAAALEPEPAAQQPSPQPPPSAPVAAPPAVAPTQAAVATVQTPEVVFRPALRYPAMAERRRIEGEVELEFTINPDGSVSDVRVLRSQPEGIFDREASGAMERWRFAPPAQALRARRVLEFRLAR